MNKTKYIIFMCVVAQVGFLLLLFCLFKMPVAGFLEIILLRLGEMS